MKAMETSLEDDTYNFRDPLKPVHRLLISVSILGTNSHSLGYSLKIYQSLGAVSGLLGAKDTKMTAQVSPPVVHKLMGDTRRYTVITALR